MKMIICRIRISKSNRTELGGGLALQPRHVQERMMIFVGGTSDNNQNCACGFFSGNLSFVIALSSPLSLYQFVVLG